MLDDGSFACEHGAVLKIPNHEYASCAIRSLMQLFGCVRCFLETCYLKIVTRSVHEGANLFIQYALKRLRENGFVVKPAKCDRQRK